MVRRTIEERVFERRDGRFEAYRTRRASRGECLNLPLGLVHDTASMGERPAITLHVYRPRIEAMRIFDHERRRTIVVDEGTGA